MKSPWRNALVGFVFLSAQWFVAAAATAAISISPSPSTGSYTVTWTAPPTAAIKTRLHEKAGSGEWSVVGTYASTVTSKAFSGKAAGTYSYKTERCITVFGNTVCQDSESAVSVTVNPPRPTVSLRWDPSTVDYGATSVLRWSSTDATYCTSGQGRRATTRGSVTSKHRRRTLTRTMTCTGPGGASEEASAKLTVRAPVTRNLSVPATSTTGNYTVRWTAPTVKEIVTELYESKDGGTSTRVGGYTTSVTSKAFSNKSAGTYRYKTRQCLTAFGSTLCLDSGGPVSVAVSATPPRPTASMAWNPSTVDYGGSSTLTWSSTNAASCTLNGATRAVSGRWQAANQTRTRTDKLVCSGPGGVSAAASATLTVRPQPPQAAVPDTPARPGITAGNTYLSVSWRAPAANGAAINDYDVQYKLRSAANWRDHPFTGAGTRTRIDGLTNGQTYQVRVRAGNAAGESGWSPAASVDLADDSTDDPEPPDKPAAPTVETGTGRLTVTWDEPEDNGAAITRYRVRHKRNLARVTAWNEQTVTAPEAVLGSLTDGLAYAVTVAAYNAAGWSVESAAVTGTPLAAPSTPTGPATSTGAHTLTRGRVTGATGYNWRARKDGGDWSAPESVAGTSRMFSGVLTGVWDYQVRACNGGGCGDWSSSKTITVTNALSVAPSPSTDGDYTVSWQLSRCLGSFRGNLLGCRVLQERVGGDGTWTDVAGVATGATSKAFSNKASGTYYYRLMLGTTPVAGPVSVVVDRTPTVTLTWDPPAVDFGGTSVLRWSSTNATSCTSDRGAKTTPRGSVTSKHRRRTQTRTMTCSGPGGASAAASATLTVRAPVTRDLSVPATSSTGRYMVSWTAPAITDIVTELHESEDGKLWTRVGGYASTVTSKAFDKSPGTYRYRTRQCLTAFGSTLCLDSGGPVSVTVGDPAPPDKPAAPTVKTGTGQLTVTWDAPQDNGAAITEYRVRHKRDLAHVTAWNEQTLTGTEATLGNLTNGLAYAVTVAAYNAAGWSVESAATTGTPLAAPPAPTGPATSTGEHTLTRGAVTGATRYAWQARQDGGSWSAPESASGTSKTFSGVPRGTWDYQVRACNSSGCGDWSGSKTVKVVPGPLPPTATVPGVAGNYIVSWEEVTGTAYYQLQEGRSTGNWSSQYSSYYGSQWVFRGKAAGSWQYRVRACDASARCGAWSGTLTVVVPAPPVPDAPTATVPDASGNYTVRWTAPAGTTSYRLEERHEDAGDWTRYDAGAALSKAFSGQDGGAWTYRVRACVGPGRCGAWSEALTVTVPEADPPDAPDAPTLTPGDGTLGVEWDAPADNGSPITGYAIRHREHGSNANWTTRALNGTGASTTLTGLDNGTEYAVQVRARNDAGDSPWSAGARGTPTAALTAPAGLSGPPGSTGAHTISWQPVTGATRYELRVRQDLETPTIHNTGTATRMAFSALADGNWHYAVRACSSAQCGPWSKALTVAVGDGTVPDAPRPAETMADSIVPDTESINADKVGTLAGEFRVAESGAATYRIGIPLPPGTAGATPPLGLHYNSQRGNGLLGVGWSLDGLSAITRCRQTYAQDGAARPLTFDENDRFCLDGARLLRTDRTQTYGAANTTYKTEIDGFLTVTAKGGSAGKPDYFEVRRKDGSVSSYGAAGKDDSEHKHKVQRAKGKVDNEVLTWALREVKDSAGNKIRYSYAGAGASVNEAPGHRIDKISYAYGSTDTPRAEVTFSYGARDDDTLGYLAGHKLQSTQRLNQITVRAMGTGTTTASPLPALRNYRLRYESATKQANNVLSRLVGVKECVGSDETVCLPETEFEWSAPTPGFKDAAAATLTLNTNDSWGPVDFNPADINGDGVTDLVWTEAKGSKHRIRYALANKTTGALARTYFTNNLSELEYDDDYGSSLTGENLRVHTEVVDYNGDGRHDLLVYSAEADETRLHLALPQSTGGWRLSAGAAVSDRLFSGRYRYADLDSDGLLDAYKLVAVYGENTQVPTGYNLEVRYLKRDTAATVTSDRYYKYGAAQTLSVAFDQLPPSPLPEGSPEGVKPFHLRWKTLGQSDLPLADVDGDGRADLLVWGYDRRLTLDIGGGRPTPPVLRRLEVFRQTGAGFVRYDPAGGLALNTTESNPKGARVADLNQDGLTDLVYFVGKWYRKSKGNYQWTGDWRYRLSTGAGFADETTLLAATSAGAQAPRSPSLVDDNGDGYPDFLYHDVRTRQVRVRRWSPARGAFETGAPAQVRRSVGKDGEAFLTVDMNGDGNGDLLHVPESGGGTETLKVYHHKTAGRAHLVTTITNGLAAETDISYESLSVTDAYARIDEVRSTQTEERRCFTWGSLSFCWAVQTAHLKAADFYRDLNDPWPGLSDPVTTAAAAPVLELMGPLYVVTRVDSSAPVAGNTGAKSSICYLYEQGKIQAAGRGLLGFKALTTMDLQTGVSTETTYRQDFPYIGMPVRTAVTTSSGKLLRSAQNTWALFGYVEDDTATTDEDEGWDAVAARHGSARLGPLQPYIETSVEDVYALPVTANGTETAGAKLSTVTTKTAVDAWGNPTNITATTQDYANGKRFQQLTENTYGPDDWARQRGRLTRAVVTRKRNETANSDNYDAKLTATRTSSFTYYPGNNTGNTDNTDPRKGLLETEVREPANTALKHTTTYDYDKFGNRVKAKVEAAASAAADGATETRCDHNTREYDDYGRFVMKEWDCLGREVQRLSTYNKHGLPTQSERVIDVGADNAASATVSTTYDYTPGGRLYFTRSAGGAYTGTVRKPCGAGCPTGAKYYIETRQPGNGTAGEYRTLREYRDALGRVVRTAAKGFAEKARIVTDTDYDNLGRVARQSAPYHAGQQQYWTTYTYDLLGRVARTELPDYQAGSVNSVITVSYAGQVTTTTNGKGQTQTETRNALGEVVRTADHEGTTVTHGYDTWGQVVKTTTAGTGVSDVTVEMAYDGRGRRTETSDPDRGTWTYGYNGFDELVKQTDAVGNVQKLSYDGLGRLTTRKDTLPTATTAVTTATWTYDPANGLGQLGQVTDGTYTRTHTYDSLGRPATTTHNPGTDETYYSKQTWDAYGRVHQVFDATRTGNTDAAWNDNVVQVHYNKWGYAYQWTDGVHVNDTPRKTYRTITSQDARGNVTGETLGGGAVHTVRDFDVKTGRIEDITGRDVLRRKIQALEYEWDLAGNLTSRGETSVGKMLTERFTYDNLNRLTEAQVTGRSAQTVRYDALGNITCKSDLDNTDCTAMRARNYTYGAGDAGPHAVTRAGSHSYTYDANGNQLTGAGRTLTYHTFNKVKSIVKGTDTTAFVYGPDRTRIKRTDEMRDNNGTTTTTTLYLGNVEKVIAPGGSYTWKRYITDGVLIEQTHDNTGTRTGDVTCYLLYDHLGSVDVITDAFGTVVQDMSFDAWGQRRAPDDWTVLALLRLKDTGHGRYTTRGYTGHEMVDAVGIIHMNGRTYDPKLGRFMQADPVIQFPDYSQSWNRYSYVLNNPLNATDPDGYFLKKLFRRLVGAVVNGIFGELLATKIPVLRQLSTMAHCALGNAITCAGATFGNAYAGGASLKRALKAGFFAYVSVQAFTHIGETFTGAAGTALAEGGVNHFLATALTGGVLTELQGGQFGHGFLAAGSGFAVGQLGVKRDWRMETQFVASVVSAGTVSEITGGKFANGAMTAAFAYTTEALARAYHYARNAENERYFRQLGVYGETNLTQEQIKNLGVFGMKRASIIETMLHRWGPGNEHNLKFVSKVADRESWWQRVWSNRYGRYEFVVRPNADGVTYSHVTHGVNMGTLNRGNNPITHVLRDMIPAFQYGNTPD